MSGTKEEELWKKLDYFLGQFGTAKISEKCNEVGPELVKFLSNNPDALVDYAETAQFTEILSTQWVTSNNPKIAQYGMAALTLAAQGLQSKWANYSACVLPPVLNKLGDICKPPTREKARSYLVTSVEVGGHDPHEVLGKLIPLLNSLNRHLAMEAEQTIYEIVVVKEVKLDYPMYLQLLDSQLLLVFSSNITVKDIAAFVVQYLAQPERIGKSKVIETLQLTLKKRSDTLSQRRGQLMLDIILGRTTVNEEQEPESKQSEQSGDAPVQSAHTDTTAAEETRKLPSQLPTRTGASSRAGSVTSGPTSRAAFVTSGPTSRAASAALGPTSRAGSVASGSLLRTSSAPSQSASLAANSNHSGEKDVEGAGSPSDDLPDGTFNLPRPKPTPVTRPKPKTAPGGARAMALARAALKPTRLGEGEVYSLRSGPRGEADQDWFLAAFEDVPNIICLNQREFENLLKRTGDDLKTGPELWERKIEGLKRLRSMVLHLPNHWDEILVFIRDISMYFLACFKDLRSQVVRECSLAFAFICKEMKNKIDTHTCEVIMAQLMNNIQNSVKVVATSAHVTLEFMFSYVTHSRLISELTKTMEYTKSQDVRTVTCKLLELLLKKWPVQRLDHQVPNLIKAIKIGINQCGSAEGRSAARRAFWYFSEHFPDQGTPLMMSLEKLARKHLQMEKPASFPAHLDDIVKDTSPAGVTEPHKTRSDQSVLSRPSPSASSVGTLISRGPMAPAAATPVANLRSNSAIDLRAAHRAKVRQQYASTNREKASRMNSLPRPAKKADLGTGPMSGNFGMERVGRARSKGPGVSQSQPSSRSGSPSSRLGYHTYHLPEGSPLGYQVSHRPGRATPRSQGTSRETSPNRIGSKNNLNHLLAGKRRPPSQTSSTGRTLSAHKLLAQSLEAENNEMLSQPYDAENSDYTGHKVSPRKTNYRPFEDHSDDSDASSLCSERSFDSYRRTSDSYSWSGSQQRLYRDVWDSSIKDIIDVLVMCESNDWSVRKDGLVLLQSYLQTGNTLNRDELIRIIDMFTKMFSDNHTKVFSLFLDTLNEVLLVHGKDLNNWLYIVLTRLLNKMGADLLGSINNKILKSLEVIRETFPQDLQMASVLRFITDPTQTPNLKVKMAALNFVTKLAAITTASQAFPPLSSNNPRDPVQAALHKMIGWTMGDSIKQGNELRRASQEAIIALFNLSTPQVTLRLANLPQEYQEAAATLLRSKVRRGSSSSLAGSTGSPTSPTPSPAPQRRYRPPESRDTANPEDVYKSLRKTTREIQNYAFETGTQRPPDKDNTISHDSGICQLEEELRELYTSGNAITSQVSVVPSVFRSQVEQETAPLSTQPTETSHLISRPSRKNRTRCTDCFSYSCCNWCCWVRRTPSNSSTESFKLTINDSILVEIDRRAEEEETEREAMHDLLEEFSKAFTVEQVLIPFHGKTQLMNVCKYKVTDEERKQLYTQLMNMITNFPQRVVAYHFRGIFRAIVANIPNPADKDVAFKTMIVNGFKELMLRRGLDEEWADFSELAVMKVLGVYIDELKEIQRMGDEMANIAMLTIAPEEIIKILVPIIQTSSYPLILGAIKTLAKVVDRFGREPVYDRVPELMPGLLRAYDHRESSVRKAAVFCMVALNKVVGAEEFEKYLSGMAGSKEKLLRLYIQRAENPAQETRPPS